MGLHIGTYFYINLSIAINKFYTFHLQNHGTSIKLFTNGAGYLVIFNFLNFFNAVFIVLLYNIRHRRIMFSAIKLQLGDFNVGTL